MLVHLQKQISEGFKSCLSVVTYVGTVSPPPEIAWPISGHFVTTIFRVVMTTILCLLVFRSSRVLTLVGGLRFRQDDSSQYRNIVDANSITQQNSEACAANLT